MLAGQKDGVSVIFAADYACVLIDVFCDLLLVFLANIGRSRAKLEGALVSYKIQFTLFLFLAQPDP